VTADTAVSTRVELLVRAHTPALLAFFARRVSPVEDAADLLSETFLAAWRRVNSIPDDDEAVRPWLFGIARNVLLHHRRSHVRRTALADRLRDDLKTEPSPGFAASTSATEVREALTHLAEKDRELITLIHWDGLSVAEAAGVLRLNESTARSRYRRAKARLREELEG